MPYNLTTMQSIYHNQDEIVEITYNDSVVYQKGGPVSSYDIRYTTTNDQKLTLHTETGVASHEFSGGVGYITLDANTPVPYSLFYNCTTLETVRYADGVTFDTQGRQHELCTSLNRVVLPSDLTAIPPRCFRACTSLNTMTVPSTVTSLGIYIWWHCGLDYKNTGHYQPEIKFTSAVPPVASDLKTFITEDPNSEVDTYNTIYKLVPYETYPDYFTAQYWKETNNYIDWYDDDDTDYESMPFYVENNTQNVETVTFTKVSSSYEYGTLSRSDDRLVWTTVGNLPDDVNNIAITLNPGQRIYLKCQAYLSYRIEGADTVGGNLASMCAVEPVNGIMPKTTVYGKCQSIFRKTSSKQGVVDARNLVTRYIDPTISNETHSYTKMFGTFDNNGADADVDLIYAPKYMYLHANDTEQFNGTFAYCTSLTHTPKFIGSTAPGSCFWKTFQHADNLVAATPLPTITSIVGPQYTNEVFNYVFDNCRSLVFIKNPTNTSLFDSNIRSGMTNGVGSNGVYVKNVNDNLPTGTNGVPSGWTKLNATE